MKLKYIETNNDVEIQRFTKTGFTIIHNAMIQALKLYENEYWSNGYNFSNNDKSFHIRYMGKEIFRVTKQITENKKNG